MKKFPMYVAVNMIAIMLVAHAPVQPAYAEAATPEPATAQPATCPPPEQGLNFSIFNDQDDVGELSLIVTRATTNTATTTIDLAMDIKISPFAFPAYRYHHRSREVWTAGALLHSRSRSDDNGRIKEVEMKNLGDRYLVHSNDGPIRMQGARLSELLWCEALAKSGPVISTLTGSLDDYPFTFIGAETLAHKGRDVAARHYRFTRSKRVGDIWYDDDGVALRVTYPTRYFTVAAFVRDD